jgi:hypothetical protein
MSYVLRATNFSILFGKRKNCHNNGSMIKLSAVITEKINYYKLHLHFHPKFLSEADGTIGIVTADFDIIGNFLIRYMEYNRTVHKQLTDSNKSCDSVTREILFNILNKFGIYAVYPLH